MNTYSIKLFSKKLKQKLYNKKTSEVRCMPDRDGTGPRARSPRKKGKKMGMKMGTC